MKTTGLALTFAIGLAGLGRAQEVLAVESARPLSEAISQLERKYSWRIHFEDPPYTDPKDLIDKTSPAYRGPGRSVDPRSGRLEIRYSVSPLTGKPDSPSTLLQMLVEDHARRGNPGHFQVRMIGDSYFVLPVRGSVLDTIITLPHKERTFWETLAEILRVTSASSGVRLVSSAMYQQQSDRLGFGVAAESARDALLRLFSTQKDYWFCWHLLYGPGWGYAFNIHGGRVTPEPQPQALRRQVTKEVKLPDGTTATIYTDIP